MSDNTETIVHSVESDPEEFSLRELIFVLWKYRLLAVVITALFTTVSVIIALTAQEIFTTKTIFITKTGNSGNSNLSNLASLAGISLGGNSSTVDPSDYLDKVIQDKEFLSHILDKKWFFKGDSVFLDTILKIKIGKSFANSTNAVQMLKLDYVRNKKIISIAKDKRTSILTLTVNVIDPQLAFDLNIHTIQLLSNYIRNSIKSQAKEKRVFIEGRIKEVKADLERNENALIAFKERNKASVSPNIMVEEMRLTRQMTISQEVYIQYQKQYEMARIEELNDQPLIQIVQNPEIPIRRSKPERKKIVVVGFVLGIFASIVSAVFYNWYAQNLKV